MRCPHLSTVVSTPCGIQAFQSCVTSSERIRCLIGRFGLLGRWRAEQGRSELESVEHGYHGRFERERCLDEKS